MAHWQAIGEILLETLITFIKLFYYTFEAIILFFVPVQYKKKDVTGQVVLITGAGSGLGRLMAVRFAKLRCHLVLWDVNAEGNEETAKLVKAEGSNVKTYVVDVTSRDTIYKVANQVKAEMGTVDILVNNAGIVTGKHFLDCPDSMIQKTMDVNVNAHFWTVKAFLPGMLERNRGHIVNIASSAGLFGVSGLVDYCTSKFAAIGFDEALRTELYAMGKSDSIKTTVICPFFINTGMFDGVSTKTPYVMDILSPEYVVDKIIEAVLTNQDVLCLPRNIYLFWFFKGFLPTKALQMVAERSGALNYMDRFVGRQKKD